MTQSSPFSKSILPGGPPSGERGRSKRAWAERFKQFARPPLYRAMYPHKQNYECSLCGYRGPFMDKKISRIPGARRLDSKCLNCGSNERHRIVSLVLDELCRGRQLPGRLLHIAPEACLRQRLSQAFEVYHTADLFLPDVDFKEDVQKLSFADGTYDCVFISRVLTIPPDLDASLKEIRRVIKPGGFALIMETYTCRETIEYGEMRKGRSRLMGMDLLDQLAGHFTQVERFTSSMFDAKYQLMNQLRLNGKMADDYPEEILVPGVGFQDLVAVCRV